MGECEEGEAVVGREPVAGPVGVSVGEVRPGEECPAVEAAEGAGGVFARGDPEAEGFFEEGLRPAALEGERELGLVVEAEAAAPGGVGGEVADDLWKVRRGGGACVAGSAFEEALESLLGAEGTVSRAVDDAPLCGESHRREAGEAAATAGGGEVEEGVGGAGHVVGVPAVEAV